MKRLFAGEPSPGERLSIGLIGCGSRGASVAGLIAQTSRARLAAVADSDPARARALGEKLRVDWTADPETLFAQEAVGALYIATPHHLHVPLALRAAQARKAIIVEKPLADSLPAAREALRAARGAGVPLSVVFQMRYHPLVKKAKALIEAGAIGEVWGTLLVLHEDKPAAYWSGDAMSGTPVGWQGSRQKSGGGILINRVVHYLDLLRHLTGQEITEVSARCATFDSPVEVEDSVLLSLRYSGSGFGTVSASFSVRGSAPYDLRIWGRDGQISLVLGGPPDLGIPVQEWGQVFSLRLVDGRRPGRWSAIERAGRTDETVEYLDRFASAVLEGRPPEIPGEAGFAAQAVVEAAYTSAREGGRPCKVEEWSPGES